MRSNVPQLVHDAYAS